MRAFCYLRVSSTGQTSGDGFPRQLEACSQYATANGIEISEVFRESLTCTSELDDRPALSELFAALEENGIKTVIVEKLDRLARDLMVQETIIADMQKRGFTLLSTCEPDLCSTDPSRVLVRQIFGSISQYEKSMVVLKLRGARQRKKLKAGRCEGVKPFGHFQAEQVPLTAILAHSHAGYNAEQIAEYCNSHGHKTRSGVPWRASSIRRILGRHNAH